MSNSLIAALKTFGKYAFWTLVVIAVDWIGKNLGLFNMPDIYVPLIAAILKSIATFAATQQQTNQ
jgi:hypothetical protein